MTNGNIETRVSALEGRMEQIQATLQQVADLQALTQQQLKVTLDIANSNARAIQAWESRINQVEEEAEEERSELRVNLNTLSTGVAQMQVGIDELRQASRENIAQHFDFRERFDRMMGEIEDLRRTTD